MAQFAASSAGDDGWLSGGRSCASVCWLRHRFLRSPLLRRVRKRRPSARFSGPALAWWSPGLLVRWSAALSAQYGEGHFGVRHTALMPAGLTIILPALPMVQRPLVSLASGPIPTFAYGSACSRVNVRIEGPLAGCPQVGTHADGHLTALIDWELSHVGDPMLDLGVIRMRNMLYPTGSLKRPIAYYEEVSGRPLDWQAVSFYTVMSMLLTPIGVSPIMQHPSAHIEPAFPAFGWNATLRRGLTDALAEAIGVENEPPELPEPPAPPWPGLVDYLVEYLDLKCAPIDTDDAGRFEISAATSIARAVQLESAVGAALLDDDLRDMGKVLGSRPTDREDGLARLNQLVADGPADRLAELIWLFARTERRREYLHTPMMIAQDSGDFEPLAPGKVAR